MQTVLAMAARRPATMPPKIAMRRERHAAVAATASHMTTAANIE
jgi:hypothetical protein